MSNNEEVRRLMMKGGSDGKVRSETDSNKGRITFQLRIISPATTKKMKSTTEKCSVHYNRISKILHIKTKIMKTDVQTIVRTN